MKKRALALILTVSMIATPVVNGLTVVKAAETNSAQSVDYVEYATDEVIADFSFGKDITKDSVYSDANGYGFSTVEFPNEAKGWSGSVYYPRVATVNAGNAGYVTEAKDALAIGSKVWTETESSGYGVYTYENTSSFDYKLPNADYLVEVTLVNPTTTSYTAYLEAEDITKVSGIEVAAGATVKKEFLACLVDGTLNLKFLSNSSATNVNAATIQNVYVSNVKITRQATNEAREDGKTTIYIASDSTVQSYDSYYNPQTGWGQTLANFFGDGNFTEATSVTCGYSQAKTYVTNNAVIENRAIGGRSSYSFINEGKLDDLLEDIRPGDFLLIQWGHNDATTSRPNRYVSSADFEKWIQYYVDGAMQRGATPILVTPVARYSYTTDSEGKLISFASNFEAYRQVMVKMSKEQGIALVDLTQRSIDIANSFGIDGAKSLFLHVTAGEYTGAYANGATDSTHLQWYGAFKFAQAVAKGMMEIADGTGSYANETFVSDENRAAVAKAAALADLREATTTPGTVTGLNAGTIGASSASISWDVEKESELYYIYRAAVDSEEAAASYVFPEDAVKYSVSRGNKYTDTACEGGKTYVYAIRGFNSMGLGDFSEKLVVTTKAAGLRFDFNYNNSATQFGWIGINQNQKYDAEVGYGWSADSFPNNGRYRGNNGTVSDDLANMAADFNLGNGTFLVDLPNGDYEITVYAADLLSGTSTIKPSYWAEDVAIGGIACKQSLGSLTAQVRVTDGQLTFKVGGTNAYICGLTITELLLAPTGLVETEASVSGNNYTFLVGFNGVDVAAGYTIYKKGTTDTEFKAVKTFTVEEYLADELSCRAMSVNLGEDYQYYVTCYTADGTESAPSNTITVSALLSTVSAPEAPENVICVNPTKDTEGVVNSITIAWDASKVADANYPVIKYIVYRSDRAEDAKGYTGFVKIGETSETSFTDNDSDLATNVHYYYKVCASNAGGAGALSAACETPITGKLAMESLENLTDRALYAIALSEDVKAYATDGTEITEGVYLSWRAFTEEFDASNKLTTTFTVYVNDVAVKTDLKATNIVLTDVPAGASFKVVGSADEKVNGGLKAVETKSIDKQYVEMQLYKPADETMPDGTVCSFTANDMSVGDLDGDGVLELFVKWYPGNAQDNSKSGYTGKTIIDAYDVNWATGATALVSRIDLGVNIRSGAHYTQFQVWDFDGDGRAEVAVKTADGSTIYKSVDGTDETLVQVEGAKTFVGACDAEALPTDVISEKNDYRNSGGYVLTGPEYFTIFNPYEGTILDTVDYTPARGTVSRWGDGYGNRVDRFLSATAYLDGVHPFAVMCRGYYTRTALTAYGTKDTDGDGIGDKIYELWAYDTDNGDGPEGQGNHNLSVADVDCDGKDEIIYGSSCYDHDGTLLYSTGLGHGDAMHVSDWLSWNDGLEVMEVHEEANRTYQVEIHDAQTGEFLIGYAVKNADVGRGMIADIDPTAVGPEFWASNGPSGEGTGEWDSTDSSVIATNGSDTTKWNILSYGVSPAANATLYWDGDLLAEIQDHVFNSKTGYYPISTFLAKWNYQTNKQERIFESDEIFTSNGTKGNLGLIADLTGDWRDEFIARCSADDSKVRLYQTTYVTDYVIPCSLDDLEYREGVAWENVAYNQPTHTSYLISKGLVTANITENEVTGTTFTMQFTPANDGSDYGHEITAYEIYRDGVKIDTVAVKDLKGVSADEEADETIEEAVAPVEPVKTSYAFDFGAGAVAEGYTAVGANAIYSEEIGYGFTDETGLSVKAYKTWEGNDNAALYNDCVLGWIANGTKEFDVKLPNGTYDVTFTIANGSGAVYEKVTAEGVDFTDVRRGNKDIQATFETKTVVVEDGVMNISAAVTKNGYAALYFTALTITETEESYNNRVAAYETALAAYEAALAASQKAPAAYLYTDTGLSTNTTYTYQVAAVVDGKTSFLSKPFTVTTLIDIVSVNDFEIADIVAGTPVKESVTELFPATVTVIDGNGETQVAAITYDVTGFDLNTPGTYTVIATVAGYASPIEKSVKVIANEIKGFEPIASVKVIAGSASVALPETVTVEYTNTTTASVKVSWNTDALDLNTVGEYVLTGTLETELAGLTEAPVITVIVAADYAVAVETTSIEVAVGDSIVKNLPETVLATMASGQKKYVPVTWKTDGVDAIDTSVPSQQMIHGTVENLDADVLCDVVVNYKALYKFDFGINANTKADGWTTITVNGKGGKKTIETLGVAYSEAIGYGFLDPAAIVEGRQESVAGSGMYPTNVTTDFALSSEKTLNVDVPNGEYLVQVMTNCGIGSTEANVNVEGTVIKFKANKSFTVQDFTVTVEDGQLTIHDESTLARIGAIVVRQIKEEVVEETFEIPGVEEDGKLLYTVDGKVVRGAGVVPVVGSLGTVKYIYVMWDGTIIRDKIAYVISKTNGYDIKQGSHYVDEDGFISLATELREIDGKTYAYIDGILQRGTGLIEIDGTLYYTLYTGEIVKNKMGYVVSKTNGYDVVAGNHYIDENGVVSVATEFREIDGQTYAYIDGVIQRGAGLIQIDGKIYYAMYDGRIVKNNKHYKVEKTDSSSLGDIKIEKGYYAFDENGVIVLPNE